METFVRVIRNRWATTVPTRLEGMETTYRTGTERWTPLSRPDLRGWKLRLDNFAFACNAVPTRLEGMETEQLNEAILQLLHRPDPT